MSMEAELTKLAPELDMPPYEWYNRTDFLSNYSFVLPFEVGWDRHEFNVWNRRVGVSLCYVVALLYLAGVFVGQKLMSYRSQPFKLRLPMTVFNFGLALFSLVAFARITPELFRVFHSHGFVYSVCVGSWTQDQVPFFWMKLFVWSKYVELIDTLFLILKKRPVSFLHWYHHASVLVYTWNAMSTLGAVGRWFTVMNYGVHSLMYGYFAWRSMGYGCPRWIPILITTLQLGQMVLGCFLVCIIYGIKTRGDECHMTWKILYGAAVIYASYFYLFLKYFYSAYIKQDKRAKMPSLPCLPRNDEEKIDEGKKIN